MRKNLLFLAYKTNQLFKIPFQQRLSMFLFTDLNDASLKKERNFKNKKLNPEPENPTTLRIPYFSGLTNNDLFSKDICPAADNLESFLKLIIELNKEAESNQGLYNDKFESLCFKKYSYLISTFLEKNKTTLADASLPNLYDLLDALSKFQKAIGGLKSSKTIELEKRLINGIFSDLENLSKINLVDLLEFLIRLDYRNRNQVKLLFTALRINFSKYTEGEKGVSNCLRILKYMVQLDYKEEVIALFICEILSKNLKTLTIQDLSLSIFNFVRLKIKLNSYFLFQVSEQVLHKKNTIKSSHAQILLSSFAESEKIISKNGPFFEELDPMYHYLIDVIKKNITKYSYADLAVISNSLQKISYFDEELIEKIIQAFTKGLENHLTYLLETFLTDNDIKTLDKFNPSSTEYREELAALKRRKIAEVKMKSENKKNEISFDNISKVLHCLAIFNVNSPHLNNLIYDFIQEVSAVSKIESYPLLICLSIWSICTLDPELPPLALSSIRQLGEALSETTNKKKYEINEYEVNILNLSLKFLRNSSIKARIEADKIASLFESFLSVENKKYKHINKVSMLCLDVCKYLEDMNIPIEVEKNITDNIYVDIYIPPEVLGKGLVIEIHGYQHFMRNCDRVKGGSVLKKYLLEKMGFIYEFIPAYEWQLLEDSQKPNYIEKFLTLILNKNK